MTRKFALAVAAVALIMSIAGCGDSGPSAEEKQEAAERRERVEKKKAEAVALAREEECGDQLGDFLSAMEELDARLEVGLNYDEYFSELGNIQVAYNQLPINDLDPRCLGHVGVPSEKAFQAFSRAGEAWDECFEELTCSDEISPEVQDEWLKGSQLLSKATELGMVEVGAVLPRDEGT